MINPIIKTSGIDYSFKNKQILHNINLQIKRGEILGLVGPNGAGKTTIFNILTGLIKPNNGTIEINGTNLNYLSITQKSKLISVVPQNTIFPEDMSVFELISMGRNPHLNILAWESAKDNQITIESIKTVGLLELASKKLKHISGGEKQLALIATAICQESPIMLLDEPTSNLDMKNQFHIMDTISEIQQNANKAIIITLHDLNLASKYCDNIVFLKEGSIFCQGTPADVITSETIEDVYGIPVHILNDPTVSHPIVHPITKTL